MTAEHGEKPHTLDQHINEPMSGKGKNEPPSTMENVESLKAKEDDMPKAGNVKKAAAKNTTAAARSQYGKTGKATKAATKAAAKNQTAAARARKQVVPVPVVPAETGPTVPDYPPPPEADHSAQATDTAPPKVDRKGNRVE